MNHKTFYSEILNTQGKAGIYMCTQGQAELLVNGKLFLFERGIISVISPIIHIQALSLSEDCDFLVIKEDIEHLFSASKKFTDIILEIRRQNNVVFKADEAFMDFIFQRHKQIEEKKTVLKTTKDEKEIRLYSAMIYLLEQELTVEILALACRNAHVKSVDVDKNTAVASNFILSINKNPTHNRSVSFYAEEAGLSVGHFTRIVKESTRRTPTEWIAFFTIAKAKNLLENTRMSIKEIAMELRFPEQFTFRKYFKQHVGIPPKQYRKESE